MDYDSESGTFACEINRENNEGKIYLFKKAGGRSEHINETFGTQHEK